MSFMELAEKRYSERYFDSRPVEQGKIGETGNPPIRSET